MILRDLNLRERLHNRRERERERDRERDFILGERRSTRESET